MIRVLKSGKSVYSTFLRKIIQINIKGKKGEKKAQIICFECLLRLVVLHVSCCSKCLFVYAGNFLIFNFQTMQNKIFFNILVFVRFYQSD